MSKISQKEIDKYLEDVVNQKFDVFSCPTCGHEYFCSDTEWKNMKEKAKNIGKQGK